MVKKNKKIVSFSVLAVLLIAMVLGFLFSDTQDFMSGMDNQEEAEQVDVKEGLATIAVFSNESEIKGSPVEIDVDHEMDVLAYMVENFSVEGTDEGFITSIEGIEQDESEGLYWLYYINEEMPSVGAGEYIVEDGDLIEWKLESSE